ncbi:Ribosome production factor [Drechslerella dactyloides]|uniref:Ribosome production factor n=1 Tax=Drechslerella dactyloides TaxID=74499 RepID=A0AAD6J7I4_DREDA|nr:Ribosome production factor [Drechslerella dactyloides]
MPSRRIPKSASSSSTTATAFSIKNKIRRSTHNVALRTTIAKAKRQARFERRKVEARDPSLRRERLRQNVPQTLDSKRVAVDKPWVPSVELIERAKRKRDETESVDTTTSAQQDDSDEDSDEDMTEEAAVNDGKHDISINVQSNEDDEDEDGDMDEDKDGDEDEDDLGSLCDSDSDSETDHPSSTKQPKPSSKPPTKPPPTSDLPEETLSALLSLIPHPSTPPKPLLTTTRMARRHDLYQTLSTILPNTTYVPRGNRFTIPQIASFATNRKHTHLLVALEDSKKFHGLIVILLPAGPTFHFSLTNYADGKAIQGRGVNTNHVPELILNNFTTPIGRLAASLFQSLYPPQPQFVGRQVVTLHNQRDYIFFRMHRYVFRSIDTEGKGSRGDRTTGAEQVGVGGQRAGEDLGVKVGLQELGPQFTLKLRRVERGVCEGVEWEWKGRMEKDRKMFHL